MSVPVLGILSDDDHKFFVVNKLDIRIDCALK